MLSFNRTPTYNLKVVLYETGLTADVLRAWERRYEMPKPQRSPKGHRLYSVYDIETVKWLKARQSEGLSISRAVELWRRMVETGRDPLLEYPSADRNPGAVRAQAAVVSIETLRAQWLEAGLAFQEIRAEEILDQAFSLYPLEAVCTQILMQGMNAIGAGWHQNKVTVQQEHFLSALAIRRLETLASETPRPMRKQTILLGCPPGEWHTLPVLLLNLFLRRKGLAVVYLGADVAGEQIEETIDTVRPELVVLAAQQLPSAASLRSVALVLQAKQVGLAYGGLIFNRIPNLRQQIPAYFLGENLESAVPFIEQFVLAPAPFAEKPAENAIAELAAVFQTRRPVIEMGVLESLRQSGRAADYAADVNVFFGSRLSAALELGDPAWLEPDLAWVQEFLAGKRIPVDALAMYLDAYARNVQQVLGDLSRPLTDWIASYQGRLL